MVADSLEENINHFTEIFDEEEENQEVNMSQHPYNTRNRSTVNDIPSTSQPDTNNSSSKTANHREYIPHLEYDFIKDFKKARAKISMYELMKFLAIHNQAF